jgi:hypothetical protein
MKTAEPNFAPNSTHGSPACIDASDDHVPQRRLSIGSSTAVGIVREVKIATLPF